MIKRMFYVETVPGSDLAARIMSDAAFATLQGSVCEQTLKGIADMGFTQMTEIQAKTIPPLLDGRSVFVDDVVSFVATIAINNNDCVSIYASLKTNISNFAFCNLNNSFSLQY